MTEPERCPTCRSDNKAEKWLCDDVEEVMADVFCRDPWHKVPTPAPDHSKGCATNEGDCCNCGAVEAYQAQLNREAHAPAEGSTLLPDTFALEFMQKNNGGDRRMSNGLWYLCMQQFTEAKTAPLREQLADHEASFDLRWKADMRAIKRWQEAHPGNENVWPDHADLCVWLIEENERLHDALKKKS